MLAQGENANSTQKDPILVVLVCVLPTHLDLIKQLTHLPFDIHHRFPITISQSVLSFFFFCASFLTVKLPTVHEFSLTLDRLVAVAR